MIAAKIIQIRFRSAEMKMSHQRLTQVGPLTRSIIGAPSIGKKTTSSAIRRSSPRSRRGNAQKMSATVIPFITGNIPPFPNI